MSNRENDLLLRIRELRRKRRDYQMLAALWWCMFATVVWAMLSLGGPWPVWVLALGLLGGAVMFTIREVSLDIAIQRKRLALMEQRRPRDVPE